MLPFFLAIAVFALLFAALCWYERHPGEVDLPSGNGTQPPEPYVRTNLGRKLPLDGQAVREFDREERAA